MWISLCNRCINNHFIVILLGKRHKVNNLVLFLRELELCRLDTRNSLLRIPHWLVNGFQVRGDNTLATAATTHTFIWSMHLLLSGSRHFTGTLRIWTLSHLHSWRWGKDFIKFLLLWLIMIIKSFILYLKRHLKYWTSISLMTKRIWSFMHNLVMNPLPKPLFLHSIWIL